MDIKELLAQKLGEHVALEEIEPGVLRLYAPFFHEDGDMYSIYLDTSQDGITIRDFGNTLMRVSYTFNVDTDNKRNILSGIVKSNNGELDEGELVIHAREERLPEAIFQYSQLVSKVSNIDILKRETVRSMFYDYLNEFIVEEFSAFGVRENVAPTNDAQLLVDYEIPTPQKPIYLFGVNENTKASKVVISCLTFQKKRMPFRSVVIHEDFNSLTTFNRNQITNASDKQFTSLDDFKSEGIEYINRELAVM